MNITKAVFPVAGLGTRFLPATKANPKEMLPVVDKPLIQYAVEEAVQSGITELIFVTSSAKRAIEDHFDSHYELEHSLALQNKSELLGLIKNIVPKGVSCIYVRQPHALGLGHAILCAKQIVGNEPFAVLLADDLISANPNCLKQMIHLYQQQPMNMIAVQKITKEDAEKYGVIKLSQTWHENYLIDGIVEKPTLQTAPSEYGVVGRYLLMPEIFTYLSYLAPGKGGEIQLTDAISQLIKYQNVKAYPFKGKRYDCGSKFGYLQAIIELGLMHPEVGQELKSYLTTLFEPTCIS